MISIHPSRSLGVVALTSGAGVGRADPAVR
jgi:hypothetical protein